MEMYVAKKVAFDAAHYLPEYEGPCKRLHGHRWEVEAVVRGPYNPESGFVLDLKVLKKCMHSSIVDKYDHKFLNDFIENPTAENLALEIQGNLLSALYAATKSEDIVLNSLKVWESPDSYVILVCN